MLNPRFLSTAWPERGKRVWIGKEVNRIDGIDKASGRAKYTYDINRPNMAWGKFLFCPHAHARVKSIDVSAAEAIPGVRKVEIIQGEGSEILYHGDEIALVVADTEDLARDGVRAIKVEYEVLDHLVDERDFDSIPRDRLRPGGRRREGNVGQAFSDPANLVIEGQYGIPMITHCCLEAHGVVAEWESEDQLTFWISTQNVSGMSGQVASAVNVPASNIRTICQYIGGGFGSKFGPDRWGILAARIARELRRPVKIMLDRDHELLTAGTRPSGYARVKVAVNKESGRIVGWQSTLWGTGGPGGNGTSISVTPYIFTRIPNRESEAYNVRANVGPRRAWRAPNHPQGAALTMTALADAAAALGIDELDFFLRNVDLTDAPDKYTQELLIAADLIQWHKHWHPRGEGGSGPIREGLGISLHTWGGRPHNSECHVHIHPDGSVDVQLGSQDLGTGTRTVIAVVVAETLGLRPEEINVQIGDSRFPPSGASGGSTTVGGVSSSSRRAAVDALEQLLEKVAPSLGAQPGDLTVSNGYVVHKNNPQQRISWRKACQTLGMNPVTGIGRQPDPQDQPLASQGVGGVQMAHVVVDVETGVVRVRRFVAVQDCGLIIDPKTARSQVYGGVIMGIAYALYEECIHDPLTGRRLNPNMEFYKLPGVGDVGEIIAHLMMGKVTVKTPDGREITLDYDEPGVIGLGEPPVISPGAAISNAVANAIGVRVPHLPLTPDRVLAAIAQKGGLA